MMVCIYQAAALTKISVVLFYKRIFHVNGGLKARADVTIVLIAIGMVGGFLVRVAKDSFVLSVLQFLDNDASPPSGSNILDKLCSRGEYKKQTGRGRISTHYGRPRCYSRRMGFGFAHAHHHEDASIAD